MAERVSFRIGTTCSCVARSLPVIQEYAIWYGAIREEIDLFQLGYRTSVEASAGTHGRGGCVDAGNISPQMTLIYRRFGWTMQPRYLTNPDGSKIVPHYHGWPYRCGHLSPAAKQQERDWDRGDAGLVGTGLVAGMWPVQPWDIALRKMEAEMARTLDQMKDEIVREVVAALRPKIDEVPRRVWAADVIPDAGWVNDPKNTTVQAKNAAKFIGADIKAVRAALKTLTADVKQWQSQQSQQP